MPRRKRRKDRSEIIDGILDNWITLGFITPDQKTKKILEFKYLSNSTLKIILSESAKSVIYEERMKNEV